MQGMVIDDNACDRYSCTYMYMYILVVRELRPVCYSDVIQVRLPGANTYLLTVVWNSVN